MVQMRTGLGLALLFSSCAALARPVVVEQSGSFATPDAAYQTFAEDVAIDGKYALVTAGRFQPDPSGASSGSNFLTAFVYARSGANTWRLVRRLTEYREDPNFRIPAAVAMQNGIAVAQIATTEFWQLTASGWMRQPAVITRQAPGAHLAIDNGRVIDGDGGGTWDARVFEQVGGTWSTTATLRGKPRIDGADDAFRGGPADISGDWAVVQQPSGDGDPVPETFLFHNYGGTAGWNPMPYGSARPPAGATRFGDEVALRWPDVFVAGSNESGTYVFREIPAQGLKLAARVQSVDGYMGAGTALEFAHSEEFLLQSGWSFDRSAGVINVFRQRDDSTYQHVAVLALRNGESLGGSIAISGHRVLVGNATKGLVYWFDLPASLSSPAVIQDTFATGNGAGWTQGAGSQFATVTAGSSRVYRQSAVAGEARAVLAAMDWTAQAIEADIRPTAFAAPGSGFGLTTRYQNAQNFFDLIVRNDGAVQLRRMASGTLRTLASAAFTPVAGRPYRLRLESVGTLHRVTIDGKLLIDVDSGGPTHGGAALYTDRAQADFDNVVVSPSLQATIYANDFEENSPGPWNFSGLGFWNLWTGASVVYNQSSVAGDAQASIGASTDDQIVRVRTRLDTFGGAKGTQERWFGVMARHVDARNYYYLSLRSSNTVSLRKLVDGVITTLGTVAFDVSPATWYSLRLDAVGDQLRAFVDGKLLIEATDNSLPHGTSGPVMFRAAVDYDDFMAYQP